MPRIIEEILQSVVYLYPSLADAQEGTKAGGTGFFVWVPDEQDESLVHIYVVTARHVITRGQSPVVRMNTPNALDYIDLSVDAWLPHPDSDDVTAAPLGAVRHSHEQVLGIGPELFVTETEASLWSLTKTGHGPGDECFFVGRFVNHEGRVRNTPSVRFGVLAMMAEEPIEVEGLKQQSFLVEARSLSGYSGSPVFVYSSAKMDHTGEVSPWVGSQVRFLGIDWCHLHTYEPVVGSDKKAPIKPAQWVKENTGMAGVVPAWKLTQLLEDPEVKEMRDKERERLNSSASEAATLDSVQDESEFERFQNLTRKLVNTPKSEIDEKRKSES